MRGDLEGNKRRMNSGQGGSTGKVTEEGGMLMLKEQQVVWLSWRIGVMGEGNEGTQVRRGPEHDRCVCQAKR